MDIFGKRWENHAEKFSSGWRSRVKDGDTVIINGDISWAMNIDDAKPDLDFLEALPGRKIISKGNHDYWWQTSKKLNEFISENGYRTLSFLFNDAYRAENFVICGSRGWYSGDRESPVKGAEPAKVIAREVGRLRLSFSRGDKLVSEAAESGAAPEKLAFLHFPPVFGGYSCEEIIDELIEGGIKRCFFGHIHGSYDVPGSFIYRGIEFFLVSADFLDFIPLEIV